LLSRASGACVDWRTRKGETGEHQLFAFLTTESNDVVRPIHAKAMPVLLTTEEEFDNWLVGSLEQVLALQRPLPNELLSIVATGERSDLAPVAEEFEPIRESP